VSFKSFRLIAHGKFNKIVFFFTEKFYTYNQGWVLGETNEAVVSGHRFESFGLSFCTVVSVDIVDHSLCCSSVCSFSAEKRSNLSQSV